MATQITDEMVRAAMEVKSTARLLKEQFRDRLAAVAPLIEARSAARIEALEAELKSIRAQALEEAAKVIDHVADHLPNADEYDMAEIKLRDAGRMVRTLAPSRARLTAAQEDCIGAAEKAAKDWTGNSRFCADLIINAIRLSALSPAPQPSTEGEAE